MGSGRGGVRKGDLGRGRGQERMRSGRSGVRRGLGQEGARGGVRKGDQVEKWRSRGVLLGRDVVRKR